MPAFLAGLLLALAGAAAQAEMRQFGDIEVHYSVFGSSFLQPEVAAAYGIVRARDRALINVAVRRGAAADAGTLAAAVSGTHSDLIHKQALEFREIREGDAVYYIAEVDFIHGETRYFRIAITPAGETRPLELEFSQVLYAD
mgnify:CR=1 FL=1